MRGLDICKAFLRKKLLPPVSNIKVVIDPSQEYKWIYENILLRNRNVWHALNNWSYDFPLFPIFPLPLNYRILSGKNK